MAVTLRVAVVEHACGCSWEQGQEFPCAAHMDRPLRPLADPRCRSPKNRWCGPAAIAAVTGLSPEAAAEWVRHVRSPRTGGRNPATGARFQVKGVTLTEMRRVLERLDVGLAGAWPCDVPLTKKPTFAHWIRAQRYDDARIYLVLTTSHWLVVQGAMYIDNITRRPKMRAHYPHRRQRVHGAWIVRPHWIDEDLLP